jgi:hypothetical protein
MINATHYRKASTVSISFVAVGLALGRTLSFYQLGEILICRLVFSVAFGSLALVILAGYSFFTRENALSIGRERQHE